MQTVRYRRWEDVKRDAQALGLIDSAVVAEHVREQLAAVRAHKLAERSRTTIDANDDLAAE